MTKTLMQVLPKTPGQILDEVMSARGIDEPIHVAKIQMLWVFQELFRKIPVEAQQNFAELTPEQIVDYALK